MNEGWLITIPFLILYVDNRCIVPKKICEISIVTASFIRRGGLGRADIWLSAAWEPEGGRGKAVIRRQSGGRVRGLVPRTYRPGAPGALGGRAPSNGELAVKRPPDMAIPLKADMEPAQYVPPERGCGLAKLLFEKVLK